MIDVYYIYCTLAIFLYENKLTHSCYSNDGLAYIV